MFNMRYHIASLVAVFLALAVGLLLGGVVVERGTLDRQRESIVKSLQEDFERLSSENRELHGSTDRQREFAEEMLPSLLAGGLSDRTVVILTDPERDDVAEAAAQAVTLAGGRPVRVSLRHERFGLLDERFAGAMPSLPAGDDTSRAEAMADALYAECISAGARPLWQALRDEGVLEGDGLPESAPSAFVLSACWPDDERGARTDAVVAALARRLGEAAVPVVMAESTAEDTSCADEGAANGLPAVDHADLPEGALSMVWLLAERTSGYYGIREGAQAPFPPLGGE